MPGSHGAGVAPGQQLIDVGLFVPCGDGGQNTGQIAMRFDPVELAGFDQRCDDGPVLCARIVAREERIFTI